MKTLVITALLMLSALAAFGQTDTTQPQLPKEIIGLVGSAYNYHGSPKATLTLGGAYQIGNDYVAVMSDLSFKRNQQPGIVIRPEFVKYLLSVNGLKVYGLAGIGAQFQASDPALIVTNLKAALSNVGTNAGYNAATGLTTTFHVYKGLYLAPAFRVVKGSLSDTEYVFGINRATKFHISQ